MLCLYCIHCHFAQFVQFSCCLVCLKHLPCSPCWRYQTTDIRVGGGYSPTLPSEMFLLSRVEKTQHSCCQLNDKVLEVQAEQPLLSAAYTALTNLHNIFKLFPFTVFYCITLKLEYNMSDKVHMHHALHFITDLQHYVTRTCFAISSLQHLLQGRWYCAKNVQCT